MIYLTGWIYSLVLTIFSGLFWHPLLFIVNGLVTIGWFIMWQNIKRKE